MTEKNDPLPILTEWNIILKRNENGQELPNTWRLIKSNGQNELHSYDSDIHNIIYSDYALIRREIY